MRFTTTCAAIFVGALIAAACGSDDSGDDAEASSDTAASETTADGTQTTPDDAGADIDPDGTLRIATNAEYLWDPDKAVGGYAVTWQSLVYDRLVHTAPDGSLVPGLAESWEYSDDGSTLTFELVENVVFQDGEPFDADAVAANIERSQTLPESTTASTLLSIDDIEAVDAHTVAFHLSSPDATLPAVMSGQAGAMISPSVLDAADLELEPIGAGMFELTRLEQGAAFTVERWDDYWDPDAVQLAAIEVQILPDATARVNALRSGEIDIAELEPGDVATLESVDGVNVRLNDTLRYVYLALNLAEEPLDDLQVRQAIAHALDRDAMVEGVFQGMGAATIQPWPDGYFPHNPELDDDQYAYDPERARELLAEAGYADGFSMELIAVPEPRVYGILGEVVQAQLGEIGIDVDIRITQASALGQDFYVDKVAAGALLYTNGSVDPAITVGTRYVADGFFNPGATSTDRLETLYEEALATTDEAERTEVMQQVSEEVVTELLDMPLFFAQEPEGISDRVVGYETHLTGRPEFRGVAVTR